MYSGELKLKIMSNSKVFVGFLVGAAVGGALGLLLAPDKGSETRKKIIETGNDLGDSIAEFGGTVKDKFNEVVDGVKGSFNKTKGSTSQL
jgi:gas vesicle protein